MRTCVQFMNLNLNKVFDVVQLLVRKTCADCKKNAMSTVNNTLPDGPRRRKPVCNASETTTNSPQKKEPKVKVVDDGTTITPELLYAALGIVALLLLLAMIGFFSHDSLLPSRPTGR